MLCIPGTATFPGLGPAAAGPQSGLSKAAPSFKMVAALCTSETLR